MNLLGRRLQCLPYPNSQVDGEKSAPHCDHFPNGAGRLHFLIVMLDLVAVVEAGSALIFEIMKRYHADTKLCSCCMRTLLPLTFGNVSMKAENLVKDMLRHIVLFEAELAEPERRMPCVPVRQVGLDQNLKENIHSTIP